MIAWSRSAKARSGSGIWAIWASTAPSPSALSARGPRRPSAFSSRSRSLIAARSSSVNPLVVLPIALVLVADFRVPFFAVIFRSPSLDASEAVGGGHPRTAVVRNPVPHRTEPRGDEAIAALSAMPLLGHETGVKQNAEVLGNGWAAHLEMSRNRVNGAVGLNEEI